MQIGPHYEPDVVQVGDVNNWEIRELQDWRQRGQGCFRIMRFRNSRLTSLTL